MRAVMSKHGCTLLTVYASVYALNACAVLPTGMLFYVQVCMAFLSTSVCTSAVFTSRLEECCFFRVKGNKRLFLLGRKE